MHACSRSNAWDDRRIKRQVWNIHNPTRTKQCLKTKKWDTITELGIKIAVFKNKNIYNKMYFEFEIVEVCKNSVAYRVGIRAGNIIKSINHIKPKFMTY